MRRKATITYENGALAVRFPHNAILNDVLKQLDHRWKFRKQPRSMPDDPTAKLDGGADCWWEFPCEQHLFIKLCNLFALDIAETARSLTADVAAQGNPDESLMFSEMLVQVEAKPRTFSLDCLDGYTFLTAPFEHQRRAVAEMVHNPSWMLAHEMGAGKTKSFIDWLRYTLRSEEFLTVVLCPKNVLGTWDRELRKHGGIRPFVVYGTRKEREKMLCRHALPGNVLVTNYDTVAGDPDLWAAQKPGCICADEVHHLKNATSARSKAVRRVAAVAKYRRALSGTPAPNSPLDWYGILMFLDPSGRLAGTSSKVAFEKRFAIKRALPDSKIQVVAGYQDLHILNRIVTSVSSRVKKEECLDLPPKLFHVRECELGKEQSRVYHALRRDSLARISKLSAESVLTVRNILAESLRLLQVVGGFVPDDAGTMHALPDNQKLDTLSEFLREQRDRPAVVWCAFREELSAIAERLASDGRRVTVVHGGLTVAEREHALRAFLDDQADTFICTVQAGCEGTTLTRADLEVFYSRTYSLTHWLQAQDRLHRPGQTRTVDVVSLVTPGTVDEKIASALERKEELQEAMLTPIRVEDWL